MADKKEIRSIDDIPSLNELIDKNVQKAHKLARIGKTAMEINSILETKSSIVKNCLFKNFVYLEDSDKMLIDNACYRYLAIGIGTLSFSIGVNLGLGRITKGKIYNYNRLWRWGFRTILLTAPLLVFSDYAYSAYTRVSLYLEDKYSERVKEYMKTEDPLSLNPKFYQENPDFKQKAS
ncbi:unnamed protein product [Blepharisma stoltei]|uniref:MICOS complex subunit n=1 Tax=Blepharisma stoltei TaxID=1481888 RepID=A0AAU9KIR9_9CILI|nr:unnamed protein product [Blepharisma stoltei]